MTTNTKVFGLELDQKTLTLLGGVGGALVIGILAYNLVFPLYTQNQELQGQIDQKTQEKATKTQELTSLATVPEELSRVKATFSRIAGSIPKNFDISTLLIDITRIVEGTGAQLVKFTPGQPTATQEVKGLNNLQKVVNKVSFKATFPQTLKVLQDVERLEQLLRIENLSLKPIAQKERADLLQVDFDLVAYLLNEAPAAPASNASAAAPATKEAIPSILPPSATSTAPTSPSTPSK
ncbi:MAG: type 4a pilus biogenesis protein PilO [Gloeobacterales cyanobacterium]